MVPRLRSGAANKRQDEATSSGAAEKLSTMAQTKNATSPTSPLSPISPWPPLFDPEETGIEPGDAPIGVSVNSQELPAPERPGIGGDSMMDETLPTAKEVYGSLVVLLTSLGFILVLVWAFLPPRYLDYMGWTWYPDREWAVVIPSYLMLIVLLAYFTYAGITAFLTPPLSSPRYITDSRSNIPPLGDGDRTRFYWKFADEGYIPPAVDLPIDLVNRVLYPPRRRPSP